MREISRFQHNVKTAKKNLLLTYSESLSEENENELYKKYLSSSQEPLKMAIALLCYFQVSGVKSESFRTELEHFFRIRIRNAMEALIEEDAPEKLEQFENKEWFGLKELDEFIASARERGKSQALIYLMQVKDRKYGYQEQNYDL